MRKFNIYNITQKRNENGVCAGSPQELIQLYAMSDEQIRILQEVPNVEVETMPVVEKNDDGSVTIIDTVPVPGAIPNIPQPLPIPISNGGNIIPTSIIVAPPAQELKPTKFFTDNGIEYKTENGHLYKKTWVNVNMDYYRIVNDKTGKLTNLNGKTIQTLDWVEIKGA